MNHTDQAALSTNAAWVKSTYSSGGNNCVEVASFSTAAGVRDSKARERGHLTVPCGPWGEFIDAVTTS